MPPFLLRYLPHIVGLMAIVGGVLYFSHIRYRAGQDDIRAEVAEQVAKATLETARIEAERDALSRKVEIEILPKLAAATADASSLAARLRQYTRSRPLPQAPGPASGPPSASRDPSSDEAVERATGEVFASCARDATRLTGWIEWYGAISGSAVPNQ